MDLYGPPLPPGYIRPDDSDDESPVDTSPPISNQNKASTLIGPQIPEFLSQNKPDNTGSDNDDSNDILVDVEMKSNIGPQLPLALQNQVHGESSDYEMYGPMPIQSTHEASDVNETRAAIEKRAKNMKNKLDNKHIPTIEVVQREEWMTVPDTSRKNQLGAISRCLAPEKSSSSKESARRSHYHAEKDRKTTDELKKYNKSKRSESLLEMHKSKKKKEKKSKDKKSERKAFDRDEIAVHHFSKQQVNSVIDKAKFLNSRFSAGNKQYL